MSYLIRIGNDGTVAGTHEGRTDNIVIPEGQTAEHFEDRTTYQSRLAELRPDRPQPDDLLQHVYTNLAGIIIALNAAEYPFAAALATSLDKRNYAVARRLVADAHAQGVISDQQETDLTAAMDAHNIPSA